MTNVALALLKEPAIAGRIKRIIFMGGAAFCSGNTTLEAEFNVWFDPHAAQIVASSGVPLVMFGLDVTGQAIMTTERLNALESHAGRITSGPLE
jgi:purine nucleosidase